MLKNENSYSKKMIEIFRKSKISMPEVDFKNLNNQEILQYGYLVGSSKIKEFLDKKTKINFLKIPDKFLRFSCDLDEEEIEYRNQNLFLSGNPGVGKTHLSVKLLKNYFCEQFIPEEYRENPNFFEGNYAQGITQNTNYRKIVFVSETMCLDMYSRNIKQETAFECFGSNDIYGAWDIEDLISADLLVINDIGSRQAHPKYAETLFGIIDTRMEDLSKTTILTTNASRDQIAKVYGGAFSDRLRTFFNKKINSKTKRVYNKIKRFYQEPDFFIPKAEKY